MDEMNEAFAEEMKRFLSGFIEDELGDDEEDEDVADCE